MCKMARNPAFRVRGSGRSVQNGNLPETREPRAAEIERSRVVEWNRARRETRRRIALVHPGDDDFDAASAVEGRLPIAHEGEEVFALAFGHDARGGAPSVVGQVITDRISTLL